MILSNLLAITPNPYLSTVIWTLVILIILYLARRPFHRALGSLGAIIYRAMRMLAAATLKSEKQLAERNRRVLLAFGRAHTRRILAREFKRIHSMMAKYMEGQPRVRRQVSEIIARLEDDYARSADVTPSLPEWIPAIKTVAEIDHDEDSLIAKMLKEIHNSLNEQQKKAAETYRQTTAKRHRILAKWMPLWRKIHNHIQQTDRSIAKLTNQAESIDRYMAEFEAIEDRAGQTEDLLRANAWKQFFISALILIIFITAGFLDYHILSTAVGAITPMAGRFGPFAATEATALVLVLIAVAAGVFLTESLRVTHIFPSIGSIDEDLRRRFVWISLTLVLVFAALQSLLIYLAPGTAPQTPQLTVAGSDPHRLAVIGPAVLGAILPVLIGFAAIPLETLAGAARTVTGLLARGILGGLAVLFRLIGNLACSITGLLATCYDIIIFPAVWLEDAIIARRGTSSVAQGAAPSISKAVSESSES